VEPDVPSGPVGGTSADFRVAVGASGTTATHYAAAPVGDTRGLLVLAHGAGAGHRHPFMSSVARRLAAAGIDVVTFNFLYMEHGRRVPDRANVLEGCFTAVLTAAVARVTSAASRVVIGGKSMGGRMATHLAAQGIEGVAGTLALGYPLHPPGQPDRPRIEHLPRIGMPVLIVQGERDTFGTPAELSPVIEGIPAAVRLHVVAGGDHSLVVRGQKTDVVHEAVCAVIADWMSGLEAPARPGV